MSLTLGKSFDRNYNLRIPFIDGYYDVGIFFNKKSTFLLFKVTPDFSTAVSTKYGVKVNMFKNLESSKFCETCLVLHNYRKTSLDIINQFHNIKPEFYQDVSFLLNESITLSKVDVEEKTFFDMLNIYAFTLNSYSNEFIFLLTERQNIISRLSKKIVRTSGIQIATSPAIELLDQLHTEYLKSGKAGTEVRIVSEDEITKLSDDNED
jgi:hypothetical protein